jgi:hypothetical protein
MAAAIAAEPERVSLRLAAVPLRAALGQLKSMDAPAIAVDPEVPDLPVTLNVSELPWSTALRAIVRAASGTGRQLDFQRSGAGYRIAWRTAPATTVDVVPPPARPLFLNRGSISFRNTPLRQVLRKITAETRVRLQAEPQVEDVAISIQLYGRPANELVAATLEAAGTQAPGIRYVWDGDRYVIWKCSHGYDGTRRPGEDGNETEQAGGQRMERVMLRYASVFVLSDLLGAEVFAPTESQLTPQNNLGGAYGAGAGTGEIAAPGMLPAGPGYAFLPTINPPVVTGLCRYARCGPRYAREAAR